MKSALKFVALAMNIWLFVLVVLGGIALAFGHDWSTWYRPALAATLMVLIGVSVTTSNFKTKTIDN